MTLHESIDVMASVVISYPEWEQHDRQWIELVRKEHDKLYFGAVDAHVTFVFPIDGVDESELIDHVQRQAAEVEPIDLTLRSAQVVKDDSNSYWHTFLVPSEGNDEIVNLHDKLYTGRLEPKLRRDVPYIPHVGVGTDTDQVSMDQLADELNQKGRVVAGKIIELVIGRYENSAVEPVATVRLG
jgi:hypothetical protein